jgi:hypothetical protein
MMAAGHSIQRLVICPLTSVIRHFLIIYMPAYSGQLQVENNFYSYRLLMKKNLLPFLLLIAGTALSQQQASDKKEERLKLAEEIDRSIRTELLNKWYPQSVDSLYGGFITTFTYNFLPTGDRIK